MSKNKRVPKELAKYVVHCVVKDKKSTVEEFRYVQTQKEAKAWSSANPGKKRLYKIVYDFYGDM